MNKNNRQGEHLSVDAPGVHKADPENCPTFYDSCNCTVANLEHQIHRAEKAEARLELRAQPKIAEVSLSTGRWHLHIGPVTLHVEGDVVRWTGPNDEWLGPRMTWNKANLQVAADCINEHVGKLFGEEE